MKLKSEFIKQLLSESGSISMVRVMSLVSLIIGSIIGLYGISHSKDLSGVAQLCAVFVGSAFAGKVGQKIMENK